MYNIGDQSTASGLTVELLPDGSTAPGGLIALTQNAAVNWQYDFPAGIQNGKHKVYVGGLVAQTNGVDIEIYVKRNGKTEPNDTTFLTPYDGV